MPLLYSIHGRAAATDDRINPISPITPAHGTFGNILSEQMLKEGVSQGGSAQENPSKHALRGYDEKPTEIHRKRVLIARDLMSKDPKTVSESDSLENAREFMKKKHYRHLPVVTADGILNGMLSDRDLLRAGENRTQEPVSKHMSTQVLTATPETPIQDVAKAMIVHKIHALPIVDLDHRLIGILTSTDILRAIVQNAPLELWA